MIEGAGAFPARPEPEPLFSFVSVVGPTDGFRNTPYNFTATPFGPSTSTYTYAWSTTHGVISGSGPTVTLTVDENVTATITCDVTESETGTTKTGSAQITITEELLLAAQVFGAALPAPTPRQHLYRAVYTGPDYSTYSYNWSIDPDVGTFIGSTDGDTVTVEYAVEDVGQTGFVRCEITQEGTGIVKGDTLAVTVVTTVTLNIAGPTSVGDDIPYQYNAVLEGDDPATTTWFWEEV